MASHFSETRCRHRPAEGPPGPGPIRLPGPRMMLLREPGVLVCCRIATTTSGTRRTPAIGADPLLLQFSGPPLPRTNQARPPAPPQPPEYQPGPPRSRVWFAGDASVRSIAAMHRRRGRRLAQVLEHQRPGPDLADRVGDSLPGDVGRRAVHRLEHRGMLAFGVEVGVRSDPDAAGDRGGQVAEDVAEEVRGRR